MNGAVLFAAPPSSLTFETAAGQVSDVEPMVAVLALSLPVPNPVSPRARIGAESVVRRVQVTR